MVQSRPHLQNQATQCANPSGSRPPTPPHAPNHPFSFLSSLISEEETKTPAMLTTPPSSPINHTHNTQIPTASASATSQPKHPAETIYKTPFPMPKPIPSFLRSTTSLHSHRGTFSQIPLLCLAQLPRLEPDPGRVGSFLVFRDGGDVAGWDGEGVGGDGEEENGQGRGEGWGWLHLALS